MKSDLRKKILCSILAAGVLGIADFALAANSGGVDSEVPYNPSYVGNNSTGSNNDVYFDDNGNNEQIYVVGGYVNEGEASSNRVTVNGTNVGGVYGGYVNEDESTANNNRVVINGSKIEASVYGGFVCDGYYDMNGTANNNRVVINGSKIKESVYGGHAGRNGTADGNSVVINGSTVGLAGGPSVVYGGYALDGTANNNSITIVGSSDLTETKVYGRNDSAEGTGNKLVLIGFNGGNKEVETLSNFDSIEVKALANDQEYTVGESYTVLSTRYQMSKDNVKVDNTEQTALIGVARKADGIVSIDDSKKNIDFKINGMRINEQTAITTEARAGVTAFVNQGTEVVADNLNMLSQSEEGINTFATVSGNNSQYDTGSYVDINGWNTVIGIANTKNIGSDKLNYGAFFENGSGNYNTFNNFDGNAFRGDGNIVYNGGGVVFRFDKADGLYTEAAVRAGSVKNEVSNALSTGNSTCGYKTENAYYGGHIGIGKIFKLDNGKVWDVCGNYFYMHHEDDSVLIGQDTFDFESVDSNKLRIGARFSEQQGEKLTSYYGLAWDYEFSGDVGGTAAGYDMHTPSLEGSTVIGEVGFRYTPGKESPWYFDANVKGYVGMQEGLSGSVQAVYSF